MGAPAVWSQPLIIEHTCLCSYQCDSRGATCATAFMCWHNLHDKWSHKHPHVLAVCDSSEQLQKGNSGESSELMLWRWSPVKRGPVSSNKLKSSWAQQMNVPLTELPSLDNETLILCCWRIQKCSLRSREVFTEHQSLQHLLNGTNQTVWFLIKEHLMKWWLHVCVPSY